MDPRWFLALAYLLMGLAWLELGLLATTPNEDWWHFLIPLTQAALTALALTAALLLPNLPGLTLHWTSLALIAAANTALTLHSIGRDPFFTAAHGLQSLGLLAAAGSCTQWWLASGGTRYAPRLAASFTAAALGALTMAALEFAGHGHPYQVVQRPYAAAADALLGIGLLLAAWMARAAALTLRTPEPVIQP